MITIKIDTENSAFRDSLNRHDGGAVVEVVGILSDIIDRLGRYGGIDYLDGLRLRDSNGNTVGAVEVEQ